MLPMGVSKNNGTPKSSHVNRVFHYKPSIWGTPVFGNTYMEGTVAQDTNQQSNAFKNAMSMRIAPLPFHRNEELYTMTT